MFDNTIIFTRSGIKNGFILLGKVILSIILTLVTLGGYSIFAFIDIYKWFLRGIEINCEPVKCPGLTVKEIIKDYLLFNLIFFIIVIELIALFIIVNNDNGLAILLLTISLVITVLSGIIWLSGYLFHQIMSKCSFGNTSIVIDGSSVAFANKILVQFLRAFPLIVITLGIYLPWFSVNQMRFLVKSCHTKKETFLLTNDFGVMALFMHNIAASFFTVLTLGIGAPWITLSVVKLIIERYVKLETTDENEEIEHEIANIEIEKSESKKEIKEEKKLEKKKIKDDILDDLDINSVRTRKKSKLVPLLILFSLILIIPGAYLGYSYLVLKKSELDKPIVEKDFHEVPKKEEGVVFKKFTKLFGGKFFECKDSLSMKLICGTKDNPSGTLIMNSKTFNYVSDLEKVDYKITGINFKTDSAVSLNLEATNGSFTTLSFYMNDSGMVVLEHLPNSTEEKVFVSVKDTSGYFDEVNFMSELWDSTFKNALPVESENFISEPWIKEKYLTLDSTYIDVKMGDFYFRDVDGVPVVVFYASCKKKVDEFSEPEKASGFFQYINGKMEKVNTESEKKYVSSIKNFLSFKDERGEVHRFKIPESKEDSINNDGRTRIRKYKAPNGHYTVSVVDSKILFQYEKSKDVDTIVNQKNNGSWSFGKVAWNKNSSEFYVDNSGPTACIWKYSLVDKKLVKIVPEHEAVLPFWYEENGNGALYYAEGAYIKKAAPKNNYAVMDFLKNVSLGWPESKSVSKEYDYFPEGGLRTIVYHLLSFGNIGTWQKLSGMKVFLEGPHTLSEVSLNDSLSFGHYNPKFVEWVSENLLIFEENKNLKKLLTPVYDKYLRDFIDHQYATIKRLESVDMCFQKNVDRYKRAYEEGNVNELNYTKHKYYLADNCGLKGDSEWGTDNDYIIDSSIAFWVRRSVDGTYDLFRDIVFRIYKSFYSEDKEDGYY